MRRERIGNRRLVESVLGQRAAHLLKRLAEFGLGKAGTGRELAGALKLRIHRGALGPVHADRPDKRARRSAEDQGHAILLARSLDLDVLIEASGKELAQALLQVLGLSGAPSAWARWPGRAQGGSRPLLQTRCCPLSTLPTGRGRRPRPQRRLGGRGCDRRRLDLRRQEATFRDTGHGLAGFWLQPAIPRIPKTRTQANVTPHRRCRPCPQDTLSQKTRGTRFGRNCLLPRLQAPWLTAMPQSLVPYTNEDTSPAQLYAVRSDP